MTPYADLHMHSTASDGHLAPREVMRVMHERGIRCASLTDHDTVGGLEEAAAEADKLGLDFIPGIEISASGRYREIHLLAYAFDPHHEALARHEETLREARQKRAEETVDRIRAMGFDLRIEHVMDEVEESMPGRPHIARAMVARGIVPSESEAFRSFLRARAPAFVPKPPFPIEDAIRLVHSAGGVAVLAHPGHAFTDHDILLLKHAGLDGVEASHPSHSPDLQAYYRSVAQRYGLIATGGSDYHGPRDSAQDMVGRYGVGSEAVAMIRARAQSRSTV